MATTIELGEATRDRVLRLADDLFARHGYSAVSMRELASAAGVTKPALYYHFRDKDALFEECVLASHQQLGERLRESGGAQGLRPRVTEAARILITGSPHNPVRTRADIVEHLSQDSRSRLASSFNDNVMAPVLALFEQAAAAGELRSGVTAAQAAAGLMALAVAFQPDASGDGLAITRPHLDGQEPRGADGAAELVTDLLLSGVAG